MNPNAIAAHAKKPVKNQAEPAPVENTEPDGVETVESEEKGGGVLNLLQSGHFKGVADVRLRINFAEELNALQNQQLQENAANEFETFNEAIEPPMGDLEAAAPLTEDQGTAISDFRTAVSDAQSRFLSSETPSIEELLETFGIAFTNLSDYFPAPEIPVEEPQPTVEPTTEEPPTEQPPVEPAGTEEPPVEGPVPAGEPTGPETTGPIELVEPETTVYGLFMELSEAFGEALAALETGLNETESVLPEISEPSGNGKAFDKFMAIYEAMQNPEPEQSTVVNELESSEQPVEEPVEESIQ